MLIQMQYYVIEVRFRAGKDIPMTDILSQKSPDEFIWNFGCSG